MNQTTLTKIGIAGLGTVGCNVVAQILNNHELSQRLKIVAAATRTPQAAKDRLQALAITPDFPIHDNLEQLVTSPDIDLIVELIGGIDQAATLIHQSLDAGKSIVTANKAVLAKHKQELSAKATQQNLYLGTEASCGASIPIIRIIEQALCAEQVLGINGILNGTANFILYKMHHEHLSMPDALSLAQSLGFAESDPTNDVEGIDAAQKLILLSNLAFGTQATMQDVDIQGISHIDQEDISYAIKFGFNLVLLANARLSDDNLQLNVQPTMVPHDKLLANIPNEQNAITLNSKYAGISTIIGNGAGGDPTASAIIANLLDYHHGARVPDLLTRPNLNIADANEYQAPSFIRIKVIDEPGVLAQIASLFGEAHISIRSLWQPDYHPDDKHADMVLISYKTKKATLQNCLQKIEQLPAVVAPIKAFNIHEE